MMSSKGVRPRNHPLSESPVSTLFQSRGPLIPGCDFPAGQSGSVSSIDVLDGDSPIVWLLGTFTLGAPVEVSESSMSVILVFLLRSPEWDMSWSAEEPESTSAEISSGFPGTCCPEFEPCKLLFKPSSVRTGWYCSEEESPLFSSDVRLPSTDAWFDEIPEI